MREGRRKCLSEKRCTDVEEERSGGLVRKRLVQDGGVRAQLHQRVDGVVAVHLPRRRQEGLLHIRAIRVPGLKRSVGRVDVKVHQYTCKRGTMLKELLFSLFFANQ